MMSKNNNNNSSSNINNKGISNNVGDSLDNSNYLWTDKYKPKKISDIIGQKEAVSSICNWLDEYGKKNESIKRCLLLVGDSGVGKSSAAEVILKEYGYDIVEFNASGVRTKAYLEEVFYDLMHVRRVNQKKPIAIIMDEIDSMSGGDKGGLGQLLHYINPNRGKGNIKKENMVKPISIPPIICICNNAGEKKLLDFNKDGLIINFEEPKNEDLLCLLKIICKKEQIKLTNAARDLIIDYAQKDFRRMVHYLQSLDSLIADHNTVLDVENIEQCNLIISEKTVDLGLDETVVYALTNYIEPAEALRVYSNHKSQFICSIYENFPHFILSRRDLSGLDKIKLMNNVMGDITTADMIDKTMHKNQLWYLHKIHGILSCYLPTKKLHCDNPVLNSVSSRSRFNQQKNNEKDIYHLSSKLKSYTGTIDVQQLSNLILHFLLQNDIDKVIMLLINYNVNPKDLKTILKIDRFTEHSKITAKMMSNIEEKFELMRPKNKPDDIVIREVVEKEVVVDNDSN